MDIPTSLNGWNLTVIRKIAATGDEGERYDFKLDLPDADRLTDLACAFANTYGGFVVVGVGERGGKFNIEGVTTHDITKVFHDKLKAEPEIRTEPPKKIRLKNGKFVYVFHIRESVTKPHLPIKLEKRVFWKRMPSKNEQMSLTEVRYFMNDFERKREKLTMFLIDMHFKLEELEAYWKQSNLYQPFTPQDVGIIDSTIAETYILVRDHTDFMIFLQHYRALIVEMNNFRFEMSTSKRDIRIQSATSEQNQRKILHSKVERLRFLYLKMSEMLFDNFDVENPYKPITEFNQHRPKRVKPK